MNGFVSACDIEHCGDGLTEMTLTIKSMGAIDQRTERNKNGKCNEEEW